MLWIALAFTIILLRLLFLQLVQHRGHLKSSLDNVLRSVTIAPPRGTIYDRAGKPLAVSKQNYGLLYVPPTDLNSYMPDEQARQVLRSLGEEYHYLKRKLPKDLLQDDRPASKLLLQAEALFKACPRTEQIEQLMETQTGPFKHPLDAANFTLLLQQNGQLEAQRRFAGEFSRFIGEAGLLADFNRDSDKLALEHREVPDQADEAEAAAALAAAQCDLLRDQYRLARLYIKEARAKQRGVTSTQLEEIVAMARFLGQPYPALMKRLDTERTKVFGHEPLLVADALTSDQWLYIAEHSEQFEHFIVEQYSFKRDYPLGMATTHLLGYTGPASDAQIDNGYDQRERSGKSGLESQYEQRLRGQLGHREVEINKAGIYVAETALRPPQRGTDLYLTVDAGLQAEAYRLLKGRRGAIMVAGLSEEARGDILAMVSGPSYDATRFRDNDYYSWLHNNSWKPELNRAIGLGFPPGSTFKIAVMTAALQSGAVQAGANWFCRGKLTIGKKPRESIFHCHERSAGHGAVSIYEAMSESCDVAFYEMGRAMDKLKGSNAAAEIARYAREFGYGAKSGIDLPGEVKGTVPDREWKRKALAWTHRADDQAWYLGDTFNYSIGQGFLLVTPLQVLQSACMVAWDGVQYPPHLLLASAAPQHGIERVIPAEGRPADLDPAVLSVVRAGMRKAVLDGTCSKLNLPGLNVCAKTGTAETRRGWPAHSWVVGYYPQENPRYAFVCFFEYGGSSGTAAVPAARELLAYLQKNDPLGRNPNLEKPAALAPGPN